MQPATRPGAGRHIIAGITWAEARRVLSLLNSALRGIHTEICVGGVPLDKQVSVSHPVPESLDATGNHRARLLRPHGVNSRSIRSRSDWQGQRSARYPTTGLIRAVGPRATYGPDAAMISGHAWSTRVRRAFATSTYVPARQFECRRAATRPRPRTDLNGSRYPYGYLWICECRARCVPDRTVSDGSSRSRAAYRMAWSPRVVPRSTIAGET